MRLTIPVHSLAVLLLVGVTGCDSATHDAPKPPPASAPVAATQPPPVVAPVGVPLWTGDLSSLKQRRAIRMLVVYSKTFYFIDKGQQRGISYDLGIELEKFLNAGNKDKTRPIRVVFIPVGRDQLLGGLDAGIGDIATGGLTITPGRLQQVDFSAPAVDGVS